MEIKKGPVSDVMLRISADQGLGSKPAEETRKAPLAHPVTSTQEAVPVTDKQLEEAIERINKYLDPSHSSITFSVDKETNITVVKVMDTANNTVIRQMPTEEALAIAKDIDKGKGFLLNTKA